jgi:lipoprotein-anchoring transpeptidase ErfK/SrfK
MFLTTKFLYPILGLLCVGTAIPLLDAQRQAAASEVINAPVSRKIDALTMTTNPLTNPLTHPFSNPFPNPLAYFSPNPFTYPFTHPLDTRLVLKLRERRVYLYQGGEILTSYPVAVGKKGWETPTGNYQVIQMVENPAWEHPWNGNIVPPGPDNPLGERWIGFWTDGKNFIGFHGTPAEHLIGRAVSHGCVRMRNRDIKALFALVQVGTPITVEP